MDTAVIPYVEPQAYVDPRIEAAKLRERIVAIAGNLEKIANERVSKRLPIEKRWIEDLQQYHGRYETRIEANLKAGEKSQLFINLTRPKTDAMAARLMDLLFPTDDRNWGIGPTPVPELTEAAAAAMAKARAMKEQVEAAAQAPAPGQAPSPSMPAPNPQAMVEAQSEADKLNAIIEEARKRADLMANEIDDQLNESNYQAVMRDVIDVAAKLGTGVAKGPVTGDKIRKGWKKQVDPATGQEGFGLSIAQGDQPAMRFVDLWSFFPDDEVSCVEDGEGVLERHLLNPKKLRALADLTGFDKDAIRRLLNLKPSMSAPSYLTDLRNINEGNQQSTNNLYHVWEYTGCLSAEDMRDLALAMGQPSTAAEMEDIDPLEQIDAVVWFCQGEVLKFAIYPYDSGECMYSVFNLAKDEASIFGYGIPHIMNHPQKSLNAAWRMMMDNAGMSSAPQIVIDTSQILPADGSWKVTGGKFWKAKGGIPRDKRAFETFDIPTRQGDLAAIIQMSMQFIDMQTQMPALAQGEQGSGVTKTAQGMAILMNSANVVFRRIVKNFDDDMTTPNIRRFYDWNMQFNTKDDIKGDYAVDARGSSVLLVREMQAQNLMILAMQLGGHPVYGPMLKSRDLLAKVFQAHMIPADEVLLSDDEIAAIMAKAEIAAKEQMALAAKPGDDPALKEREIELREREINAKVEIENMKTDTAKVIATMNRDSAMMKMAETMNLTIDQISADLEKHRTALASKERIFAAEAAMTERAGASGGGYL